MRQEGYRRFSHRYREQRHGLSRRTDRRRLRHRFPVKTFAGPHEKCRRICEGDITTDDFDRSEIQQTFPYERGHGVAETKTTLTFVPVSATFVTESRSREGRQPVTPAAGASAVPAGGGSSPPLSGGFGKTPGRHDDRSATLSLDWDRKERVTPVEKRTVFRTIGIVRSDQVPGSAFWS